MTELDKMLEEIVRRAEKRSPYDPKPNEDVPRLIAALKYVTSFKAYYNQAPNEARAKVLSILKGNPDATKTAD